MRTHTHRPDANGPHYGHSQYKKLLRKVLQSLTSWRPQREFSHPHFPGQQTEAQRREATYARSQDLAEAGFEPRGSDCGGCVPNWSPRQRRLSLPALRCPRVRGQHSGSRAFVSGEGGLVFRGRCWKGTGRSQGKGTAPSVPAAQDEQEMQRCRSKASLSLPEPGTPPLPAPWTVLLCPSQFNSDSFFETVPGLPKMR